MGTIIAYFGGLVLIRGENRWRRFGVSTQNLRCTTAEAPRLTADPPLSIQTYSDNHLQQRVSPRPGPTQNDAFFPSFSVFFIAGAFYDVRLDILEIFPVIGNEEKLKTENGALRRIGPYRRRESPALRWCYLPESAMRNCGPSLMS